MGVFDAASGEMALGEAKMFHNAAKNFQKREICELFENFKFRESLKSTLWNLNEAESSQTS